MARNRVVPRCCLYLFLALVLFGSRTRAQEAANPAVDAVFAQYAKPGSPGCALGVYRDGKIIYGRGYGLADIELGVPITRESVFDIGSTSKQFTAASILLLEKQGKLSLDDEVRKYIPELPSYTQKITVLKLLNHTSGIRDYLEVMALGGINLDGVTTDDDALSAIVRQKALNFPPGGEFLYSNSGYFLLSLVVKRASGKSLREFAQDNLFAPLGMRHTQYRDDHSSLIPHRAGAYDAVSAGGFKLDISYFEQTGDGAVHTSVEDLQKWDENFYDGRLGGKEFLAELQSPGKLDSGKPLDYAKGLFIQNYRGLHTVSHGGAWGGYRAELLRFPDQHFSVACLCNVDDSNPSFLAREVAGVYLAGVMQPKDTARTARSDVKPAVTLEPSQLQALAGMYRNPESRSVRRVVAENGSLRVYNGDRVTELRALSATEFEPVNSPVQIRLVFEPASKDRAGRILAFTDGSVTHEYDAVTPVVPTAAYLGTFAGEYWSEELQATYAFAREGGGLLLHAKNLPAAVLRPTTQDEFEATRPPSNLHFTRDSSGRVSGFILDGDRMRGMVFARAVAPDKK